MSDQAERKSYSAPQAPQVISTLDAALAGSTGYDASDGPSFYASGPVWAGSRWYPWSVWI